MIKNLLTTALFFGSAAAFAQTELTLQIDTKVMFNVDCNLLGDGAGGPAQVNKVYMHSGACSENRGTNMSQTAEDYCIEQIIPFASDVWQHVVGNWGAAPQDDGVGEMTSMGDGIYQIQFEVEEYYSDPALVNNETNSTGTTQSTLLDPANPVHVLGMVFRNEDGQATGRDQQGCNDIFIVNFDTDNPTIINSTDFSTCQYVSILIDDVGISDSKHVQSMEFGPNPSNSQVNFMLNMWKPVEDVQFTLMNTMGQVVEAETSNFDYGRNNIQINVESIPAGVYLATFSSPNGLMAQERIIVQ